MRTIACLLLALATSGCIDLSGFDLTSAPTPDDVVGKWRGFASGAYARVEFKPDGTGVFAMDLPGTNVTAEITDISWHTTASNLVVEVQSEGTNRSDRLIGRMLERTLVLNDPSESDEKDAPLVQLIRMEDCMALDKELEQMMQDHRRGTTKPSTATK